MGAAQIGTPRLLPAGSHLGSCASSPLRSGRGWSGGGDGRDGGDGDSV